MWFRIMSLAVGMGVGAREDDFTAIAASFHFGTDELLLFTGAPELDQVKHLADLISREFLPSDFSLVQAEM